MHAGLSVAATPEPALRYNIAYACSLLGRYEEAIASLDHEVLAAIPAAITLNIRALHHLGRLDDAIRLGEQHLHEITQDSELPGALCAALFDANQLDAVRQIATAYPDLPETLTARGLLALETGADAESRELFERALARRPQSGRAKLGVGLWQLTNGQFAEGARQLEEAATTLRIHPGSWVAAGWAHLFNNDFDRAAEAFEKAWNLDRGFAEAPGGLAVVHLHRGHQEEAARLVTIALRLDNQCFAAKYAQSLSADASGDQARATAMIQSALGTPIDNTGRTLGHVLFTRSQKGNI